MGKWVVFIFILVFIVFLIFFPILQGNWLEKIHKKGYDNKSKYMSYRALQRLLKSSTLMESVYYAVKIVTHNPPFVLRESLHSLQIF